MEDIKKDGALPDMDSVLEMLNDLSSKLKKGDKIPTYLKSALQSSMHSNAEFTKQLN